MGRYCELDYISVLVPRSDLNLKIGKTRENYNSRTSPFAGGEVLGLRLGGVARTARTSRPARTGQPGYNSVSKYTK